MKDLYIAAHEELIEEYMIEHPDVSWSEAYELTADAADVRSRDKFNDMVDSIMVRSKYETMAM